MMTKSNFFKKADFTLALFYFFYFAMIGVYIIFMPKVLKDLNYTPVEIGAIYTSAPLMRAILPFIFKKWINLTNRVYFFSLSLTFITVLLFFIAIKNFWFFLIANFIFGGAMGAVLPFVEIIALENVGKERYGKIRLWGSIGFSAIAFILGKILSGFGMALGFLSVVAFLTAYFGFLLAKFDKNRIQDNQLEDNKTLSLIKYWAFWVSVFLFQFSFGGFYNFFTIYETSSGLSLDTVSYLWIFGVLCEIVMLNYQGPLLKRFNLLLLLQISTASAVFRWLIVAFFPNNIPLLLLSQSTHALSFALYYTASIAYVYTLYSQKKLAQQFFLGLGFGLGGAAGAIVSGIIYKYSPKGLFIFESAVVMASFILLIIHQKRREYVK